MADDLVLYEVQDRVALLTLNRPDRLNAWTHPLQRQAFDLLDRAAADPAVTAIVVTGAGRGFCAGADMDMLQGIASGDDDGPDPRPITYPALVPKPVIGAINGACAGIGLAFALCFDVRFAAAGAKFTTAFARRGLIAEHATAWTLPRLVGQGHARDLLLSARVVFAEEAAAMGMVSRVVAPNELLRETLAYAADVAANCSPTSMAIMKEQLTNDPGLDLESARRRSVDLMVESFSRPDFKEGVSSYVEKRPPAFPPYA